MFRVFVALRSLGQSQKLPHVFAAWPQIAERFVLRARSRIQRLRHFPPQVAIVRDWLGGADLMTTNRYLVTTATALKGAAKLLDAARAHTFSHKPADQPIPADQLSRIHVSEKSESECW